MGDTSYGFYNTNHKMNETQSSENESLRSNMSYLYGRDPSILAYGQRPFPSQESKKNLMSLLEEEKEDDESIGSRDKDSTGTDPVIQTIKVFLRMKPFPCKMKLSAEQADAYSIINSTTLLTKMPSLDNNASCLKKIKTSDVVCRNFMFTQTFGPETSQLQLFEEAVKPQILDFLAGKNSVVMSYGTTNSGKTYTLQGTPESPGIIPRGIEFVFGNLNPKTLPCYKPVNLCDVAYLNNNDRLQESNQKLKLLAFNSIDRNCHETTYKQMQRLLHEESPIRPSHSQDAQYSIWVSFAEIYNETIYDLLWNDCQKKRPALKLVTDNKGRAFIKGLKCVCVNSGAEAYQVLMAGQYNLKVAATALNSRSSRSHCIFTIKLLKYRNEHDPLSVHVSTFSFCDLAGSERLKKTLNVGERLKEAQNINTSLLVLGRCLKQIYESQASVKQKNESIGPFRESKLTRLFQRALSGKEQIALIVNVNPVPNLYVETQNVLNFSAIAKKIVIERNEVIKRRHSHSRFSRLVTQSIKTEMDWETTELDDQTETSDDQTEQESDIDDQEAFEELLTENELLKKEIKELKASALTRDMKTRQEMSDMYSDIMKKLESEWKTRLIDMEEQQEDLRELAVEQIESFYTEKLNQLTSRKRSRQSDGDENDSDDERRTIEEVEIENNRLLAKIETLKKSIRDLKQAKEAVESEKTKISFQLAVANDEVKRANEMLLTAQTTIHSGGDVSANYITELNDVIKKKDDRIKTMKTFLNEAKEEYIFITNQGHKLENQLKARDEALVEHTEHISDLEEQLNQANAYSSEQSKIIESLEEELEQHSRKLMEADDKIKALSKELLAKTTSQSDKDLKISENESANEELIKNKALVEEMKLRLELSEEERMQMKKKLNQRVDEIELLKNNLDLTKNQLDKVTEKINILSIEDSTEKKSKKKSVETQNQEVQTEIFECSNIKTLETVNISCQASQDIVNTSCQTLETGNNSVETDEKGLQTSIIVEDAVVKTEVPDMEAFNELQKHCEEINEALKSSLASKADDEKRFEDKMKNLQTQIDEMIIRDHEKTDRNLVLQSELESRVKESSQEIQDLKILVEAQENRIKNLMDQITEAHVREQDKEGEISSFQKEVKNLIQLNGTKEEQIRNLELEIKKILNDNTAVKEQLAKSEEKNKKMDKDYKQVIHILENKLDMNSQEALEKKIEMEQIKLKIYKREQEIEDLKKKLNESEHELIEFTKNRDEYVSKYEQLLDSQREDLEKQKKEITRLHDLIQETKENSAIPTSLKNKKSRTNVKEAKKTRAVNLDVVENTSDEDRLEEKLKQKKEFLTPTKDNIVIELSETGSESKSQKSSAKDPPTSVRRTTRKKQPKKLFTLLDSSYVDLEPSDPSPAAPRSLRNRRKQ